MLCLVHHSKQVGMKSTSILVRNAGIALFSFAFFIALGSAATAQAQSSSAIAQSFKTTAAQKDIVNGALVSTNGDDDTIELATLDTTNRLIGVVDSDSLVSLSTGSQEVEVVLSGTTNVLVSDINGVVKSGDKITVSPVAGVGMKATTSGQVVGTAQQDLTSIATRSITDRDGKHHTIHLGYVRTQINVATYQAAGSAFLPPFIQNIANGIAGRSVSLVRILACSILLLLGFITVVILVYTATRSAMTSLGRNPLAARAIRQGLYQAILISIVVAVVALLLSYLILRI